MIDLKIILVIYFSIFTILTLSQDIAFEGSVVCEDLGESELKKPAKYIIIVPETDITKSDISTDYGYYKIILSYDDVVDKSVSFLFVGKSDTVETQKVFVSREDLWDRKVKCPTLHASINCESFETNQIEAEQKLFNIKNQTREGKKRILDGIGNGGNALVTILSLMSFVPAGAPPVDTTITDTLLHDRFNLSDKNIVDGIFTRKAFSQYSQNLGFNLTPYRNLNEAIFWNTSSLGLANDNQFSMSTDYKNYYMGNLFYKFSDKIVLGFGGIFYTQKESRIADLDSVTTESNFYSDELMLVGAFASQINKIIHIGISPKYFKQNIDEPLGVERIRVYKNGMLRSERFSFLKKTSIKEGFDFDLSSTIEPLPFLRFGISIQNILGTKLNGNNRTIHLRSLGVGATYQNERINFGTDIQITENDKTEFAFGINFLPFNNVILNVGFSSYYNKLAAGINIYSFLYSYNYDDNRGSYHLFGTRFKF